VHLIPRLFELLTRKPYLVQRSMVEEHGPTPATRYPELATLTDADLIHYDTRLLVVAIELLRADGGEITRERLLRKAIADREAISLVVRHVNLKRKQVAVEAHLAAVRVQRSQMLGARRATSA